MQDPALLSAWEDPRLLGAIFIVAAATFGMLVVCGIPHMIEKRESRPLILGFLAVSAVFVASSISQADRLSGGHWFSELVHTRTKSARSEGAESAGASFATAAAPLIGNLDPKAYGDVGQMIINTSRLVIMLNEKLPPALDQVGPTVTRLNGMLDRLDGLMSEATPALKDARPVLKELPPLLKSSSELIGELSPLIQDSRRLTATLNPMLASLTPMMTDAEVLLSEIKKRDPGKMADQSIRMMNKVDGTLTNADVFLENLQFMDENWLRHFLQVEGVQAYAGIGAPDIPKASKPVEPPPIHSRNRGDAKGEKK